MTIGLALVAAAGMSFAVGGWLTPQHIIGVVLAILGLGMVAGSFVRGGRGLIGLAVPLSVAGLALTMVSSDGYEGLGDLTARPTTTAAVADSYEQSIGDVTLDLTALPAEGSVSTEARTGVGDVEVIVPADADVTLECAADNGNTECLGQSVKGFGSEIEEFTDYGADGPGGLRIVLTARTDTGNVEVRRG